MRFHDGGTLAPPRHFAARARSAGFLRSRHRVRTPRTLPPQELSVEVRNAHHRYGCARCYMEGSYPPTWQLVREFSPWSRTQAVEGSKKASYASCFPVLSERRGSKNP